MHLRVSTIRRRDKTYRYAQLVQSCRDGNGKSSQRVLKHLGNLPEPVIDALRIALRAYNVGDAVLLASDAVDLLGARDLVSRRFLDLAVLIDCWRSWNLDSLFNRLAGGPETTIPFAHALLALVLQRCCAPGSKLQASRWMPKTAIPELLRFDADAFNNTRVHRTLEILHSIHLPLQEALGNLYEQREGGGFRALFMDVTDTWFEGMGCPLAEQTRTKSEMPNKRCIAIVLLANDQGYPVRWTVVGGKTKDWTAMRGLLQQIGEVDWLRKTPIVFDRAMGALSTVAELKSARLWFLTAAHVSSFESYTTKLPVDAFQGIELGLCDESYEEDIKRVAQAARDAGFAEIHERLFAIDLGVAVPACEAELEVDSDSTPSGGRGRGKGLARQLARAQDIRSRMDADPTLTQAAVANLLDISDGRVNQLLALLRLSDAIQRRIAEEGDAIPLAESDMRPIFRLEPELQTVEFDARLQAARAAGAARAPKNDSAAARQPIGLLRMAAYFNPRLFVDIRRRTAGHRADIQRRVKELNQELAQAKMSRKRDPTYRKFARELERLHYLDAFDINLQPLVVTSAAGKSLKSFRGGIRLKPNVWARKRKHDGFVLLLGHPDLPQTAAELVGLYRGKDVVEKDFQTIKGFISLRPLFHYTDPKVIAHVTVCMLALLVERTLRNRLRAAGLDISACTALEILADCRLTERAAPDGASFYSLTSLNTEQDRLLVALALSHLANPEVVGPKLLSRD
jgi:hypothetical protein